MRNDRNRQASEDFYIQYDAPGDGYYSASNGNTINYVYDTTNESTDDLVRVKKREKKVSTRTKVIIGIIIILILFLLLLASSIWIWLHMLQVSLNFDSEEERESLAQTLVSENGPYYTVVVGSDAKEEEPIGRNDLTMLVRVEPDNGNFDVISIPRDTMVNIEGHGTQKINMAYYYDGSPGVVECVSEFAGVPISHYIEVDFDGLQEVVDSLGGVWVNVPTSITFWDDGEYFSEGEHLMNGKQVLAYSRGKYDSSDDSLKRTRAERLALEGIANRVLEMPPIALPGLISKLAECVTTDYTVADFIKLAWATQRKGATIYSTEVPGYSWTVDGINYVGTEYDEWREMMRRVDAGIDPTDKNAVIPEPQASDETLGAATNGASSRL